MAHERQPDIPGDVGRSNGAYPAVPNGARPTGRVIFALDGLWFIGGLVAACLIVAWRRNEQSTELVHHVWRAVVAVGGGVSLMFIPPPWRRTRSSRLLIGFGLALGVATAPLSQTVSPFPSPVWLVPIHAVGLALVFGGVVARLVRHERVMGLRALLEVVMVAAAAALMLWQLLFVTTATPTQRGPLSLSVLIDGVVLGLVLLTWSRRRDRGLMLAAAGLAGLVLSHLLALERLTHDAGATWFEALLACLAWPLTVIGLQHAGPYVPFPSPQREAAQLSRSVIGVAGVAAVATGTLVYLLVNAPERVQGPVWAYCGLFAVAGGVREFTRARQTRSMIVGLADASTRDPLTGLLNLRGLDEVVAATVRHGQLRRDVQLSAMTVDVNRFRDVNDLLGHASADALLRTVAGLLTELTRDLDAQVFRIAGDEFLVLARCRSDRLEAMGRELQERVPGIAGRIPGLARIPLSVTLGLAHWAGEEELTAGAVRSVCTHATQAMRQAKTSGHPVSVYNTRLAAQQHRDWHIETVLRERLAHGGRSAVAVHFQPVICLQDGRLASVEALARWTDPRLDDVTPAEFIAVAERCGLIERLGLQIMRDALAGARRAGLLEAGKSVAVNVSTLQLRSPDFVTDVRDLLADVGVDPRQLTIEVTESVFMSADDPAVRSLDALHREGVSVVLDDFGTGYSSLSYLTRLPVKGLKIDRSITVDLDNTKTHAIASSIAQMASQLDLEVVVEGVEDARQEDQVISLGLDRVQGWLYSRAVNEEGLTALINLTDLSSPVVADLRHLDNVTRLA